MRKLSLFALFTLFPLLAVATENTTVKVEMSASRYVIPDTYTLPISVSIKLKREKDVINALGKVDRTVRELNVRYRGGNYSVYRVTRWDPSKKKYIFEGFRGSLRYTFLLENPTAQDRILSSLTALKEKGLSISIEVGGASWTVSERKASSVKNLLRIKLLKKAKLFSDAIGKTLGKSCDIKSVDFTSLPFTPVRYKSLSKSAVSAPVPKRSERKLSIKATVIFNCR